MNASWQKQAGDICYYIHTELEVFGSPPSNPLSRELGKDLESKICDLQKKISELEKIKSRTETQEDELIAHRIQLCRSILRPILEEIGVRQGILIKELAGNSPFSEVSKKDIAVLNGAYGHFRNWYKSLTAPESHQERWWNKVTNSILNTNSVANDINAIGEFLPEKYITLEEFDSKKKFADIGYSLSDVLEILPSFSSNEAIIEQIKNKLVKFLYWADRHPRLAATMMSNIVLFTMCFDDDAFIDKLSLLLRSRALANVFFNILGNPFEDKATVDLEAAQFQALSDFLDRAPTINALAFSVVQQGPRFIKDLFNGNIIGGSLRFTGKLVNKVGQTYLLQAITNKIGDHADVAYDMITLAKGESFTRVLENRQMLSMVEFGSKMRAAMMYPEEWIPAAQKEVSIFFKVLLKAYEEGRKIEFPIRIFIQIVMPVGVVVLVGGIFISVMSASLGLSAATTALFFTAIPALSYTNKAYLLVNSWTDTRKVVENEELSKQAFKENCKNKSKDIIVEKVAQMLKEAKKFSTITSTPTYPTNEKITGTIDKCAESMQKQLDQEMTKRDGKGAKDYLSVFGGVDYDG